MPYDLSSIHQLIQNSLTAQEFNNLVYYHFRAVSSQFTDGQTQDARIRLLIDYVDKHQEIDKLLKKIGEINSKAVVNFLMRSSSAPIEVKLGNSEKLASEIEVNKPDVQPPVQKCDVLILSANPNTTQPLQLEKERELIKQRLQEGEVGKKYIVHAEKVAYIEDLSKYLLQYDPTILHFSGHGNADGEIILNNRQGEAQVLSIETLAEFLAIVRGRIECVILNACFSLEKADVVADQVSCVIGMDKEIDDESALILAGGFYRGLGFGQGYYKAFEIGRNEIKALKLPDDNVPRFITRDTSILQLDVVKPRITRSASDETTTATLYPLWFGTNRKPVDIQDISQGFSGERGDQLYYGICQVAVPKSHKIGSTGSPWWKRLLTLTDDRLKLQSDSLQLLDELEFWANVNQELEYHELDERSALVFIHGFNVSFEDAAKRAAQIGFDLQVPGITAFYSWASKGKLRTPLDYTADEATIEASEKYIAEFLLNLVEKSEINKIHIIAHSMGNRGLLRAMQQILAQVQTVTKIPFGQIFLAAPDVDPDLFKDLAQAYHQLAERTTLYVSSKDKALATSGIIHNYPRVGFFPPITVVEGIDTIQVSNIDLTFLGHGYFADARILLEDIRELLINNTSPHQRRGRLQAAQNGNYWIIRE